MKEKLVLKCKEGADGNRGISETEASPPKINFVKEEYIWQGNIFELMRF
jgi:hypothetical protein